jgi:ribonuclease E
MTNQDLPGEMVPAGSLAATPSEQVPEAPTASDAVAPAKRTRTRRSATSKGEETAGDELVAATAAPVTPAKRTRTRKSVVAQEPAEVAAEGPVEGSPQDSTAEVAAPAGKAPQRIRRRPAAAPASTPAELDQLAEPDQPVEPIGEAESEPAKPAEADPSAGTTSMQVGGVTRLATTALLFQAPEPTVRPRRRRAEAPAGPPRHPGEQTEHAEPAAPGAEEPAEEGLFDEELPESELVDEELSEESAEDEGQEGSEGHEGEGGARRRRRRGGRGRRGRSGGDRAEHGEDDEEAAGSSQTQAEAVEPPAKKKSGSGKGGKKGAATAEGAESEVGHEEGAAEAEDAGAGGESTSSSSRRRRRRRRSGGGEESAPAEARPARQRARTDEVTALKGSTRLEAKRQRRREGRDAGRRRTVITESEFLARRESVERSMVVRETEGRVQIGIVEDGVLVEHYVSRTVANSGAPMAGNVYLGRVQNVLPSMEAAFVDIGKGRNAVLYAGEVNWDAAGLEGQPRRIEQALKSGDAVLVQVTKEPVGHKGARLTSQITLAGRYLVYVPGGGMTGISRKLPDNERARLKRILKEIVPDDAGVIVRTAAEGASDEELRRDVQRLQDQWAVIEKKTKTGSAPVLLQGEPDLAIRVVRDVFNDDFATLVVQGEGAWEMVSEYVGAMAPDLVGKISRWNGDRDVFAAHRIDEQLAKGLDRKVWLPSGGSLVIDRTEAMTVIDVNTGKFTGSGGTLEETVTRNNLEAAEEIVRQLRLRDIGGIIVIDFIDMVLESNRDLVLRRLVECLGRDRTKHQVAEVTSLGLVQMTRKRVGQGLHEAFTEPCQQCNGRGHVVHSEPVSSGPAESADGSGDAEPKRSRRKKSAAAVASAPVVPVLPEAREAVKATLATIAAAAAHAHEQGSAAVGGAVETEGSRGEGDVAAEPTAEVGPVGPAEVEPAEPTADVGLAESTAEAEPLASVEAERAEPAEPTADVESASSSDEGQPWGEGLFGV